MGYPLDKNISKCMGFSLLTENWSLKLVEQGLIAFQRVGRYPLERQ